MPGARKEAPAPSPHPAEPQEHPHISLGKGVSPHLQARACSTLGEAWPSPRGSGARTGSPGWPGCSGISLEGET